jgi:hypothetical protein
MSLVIIVVLALLLELDSNVWFVLITICAASVKLEYTEIILWLVSIMRLKSLEWASGAKSTASWDKEFKATSNV